MKIQELTRIRVRKAGLIAFSALCFACAGKQQQTGQALPEYAVVTLLPGEVSLSASYPAVIRGRQDVEIRPNVSGFITKLCVDEGAMVRKGQVLFRIDPVQYEEAVNVARAAVKVAESNVATAKLTVNNKRELAKKAIISEYDLQMAENTLASQQAALAQAQAQLVNAEKNLSYTEITSPSDGVVGTLPFRVGALVSATSATPLTIVSDISQMYVYFSMTEKQLLNLIRQDGSSKEVLEKMPLVELELADGSLYPEKGKVETISGVIDQATGAVSVRATFDNRHHLLRSGGTGVVKIPSQLSGALVIPQKATYEIQDKKFVYKVQADSTVRNVEIGIFKLDDGKNYVVTSGLKPGDRVVTEGVGTLRNGIRIKPITPEQSAAKIQAMTAPRTEAEKK